MSYTAELKTAISIAREAGEVMREYFYGGQQRVIKTDGTPLTIADTTINSLVIKRLAEEFPDDGVIGEEESTAEYGGGRKWICDPIDGTKAFTWGVPTAMFSLALVVDGTPIVGVAYEPMLDQLYRAVRGEGSFCNDQPIHVNATSLDDGILGTISSQYRLRREASYLDSLLDRRIDMAAFSGAVAKCIRVADGHFVGYIEELVNPHDVAASHVIVTEAGGKITDLAGNDYDYTKPFRGTIVSNGVVHDELVAAVRSKVDTI